MNNIILEVHTCNIDYDYRQTKQSCYIEPLTRYSDNVFYIGGSKFDNHHLSKFRYNGKLGGFGKRLNSCGLLSVDEKGLYPGIVELNNHLISTNKKIIVRLTSQPEKIIETLNFFNELQIRVSVLHISVDTNQINNYDYLVNEVLPGNINLNRSSIDTYLNESSQHETRVKQIVDNFEQIHEIKSFNNFKLLNDSNYFNTMLEFLGIECDHEHFKKSVNDAISRCDKELQNIGYKFMKLKMFRYVV